MYVESKMVSTRVWQANGNFVYGIGNSGLYCLGGVDNIVHERWWFATIRCYLVI